MTRILKVKTTYNNEGSTLYEDCYIEETKRVIDLHDGDEIIFNFWELNVKEGLLFFINQLS